MRHRSRARRPPEEEEERAHLERGELVGVNPGGRQHDDFSQAGGVGGGPGEGADAAGGGDDEAADGGPRRSVHGLAPWGRGTREGSASTACSTQEKVHTVF